MAMGWNDRDVIPAGLLGLANRLLGPLTQVFRLQLRYACVVGGIWDRQARSTIRRDAIGPDHPCPLAGLSLLNPHCGAFGEMSEHGNAQIGSAHRAEVALPHNDIRADLVESQSLGALRADRDRMIGTVDSEERSLVRCQHEDGYLLAKKNAGVVHRQLN
jgi:hypothetical protein